ncbi:MAG: tRNA pseudouridine(38-40) synthase TruA [Alphaproteobacteria bacterium]
MDYYRYKIYIEYNGMKFHGWQSQKDIVTVQDTIEKAIFSLTGEKIILEGAGRTDKGVHAIGQVAHFDLSKKWSLKKLLGGLNFYLHDINATIVDVKEANFNFHARFSAKYRVYEYYILNRSAPPALHKHKVWHVPKKLNIKAMQTAAKFFIGHNDLSAFRAADCQSKNPFKTIDKCMIHRNENIIIIRIKARSFLHNQVRIMAGTLKLIGEEKRDPSYIQCLLENRSRIYAGPTAPPYGLYLVHVEY